MKRLITVIFIFIISIMIVGCKTKTIIIEPLVAEPPTQQRVITDIGREYNEVDITLKKIIKNGEYVYFYFEQNGVFRDTTYIASYKYMKDGWSLIRITIK